MRTILLLVPFLLAGSGVGIGQETTGTINGRVVDAQGLAIPGATVTVSGSQGTKRVMSDAEGRYSARFLTPGQYTVRAELEGFKPAEQPQVAVGVGQVADVVLKMTIGGVAETVQVVGTVDVVNLQTTTIGANISSDTLQLIPVGRQLASALYLAPGVSSSSTAGHNNPSIGGGSGLDNRYVIDGVNVTNQGYGALGSYSIIFGSLGNATPFDFIQEVQVKTGGQEAEFGQSVGGLVNVITKSGTNQLTGSIFGYRRPSSLEAGWTQYQSVNGSVQTVGSQSFDAGASTGFPIVADRLFFFGAIDPERDAQIMRAPDGFPLAANGDIPQIRHSLSYSTKGTWQLTPAHRVDVSFFGDPSNGNTGPQRTASLRVGDTASFSSLTYGGHNQTVRYSGVMTANWLIEGSYARALNRINELPSVDAWRVTDTTVTPQTITGGIGLYEKGNRGLNNQFTIKSSNVISRHQLKYGFEYDNVDYSQVNQRTGPTFLAPDGRQTATGASISILPDPNFGQIYRVTRANFNTDRPTTQHYWAGFVQDSWQVTSRLTINPGLRYEQETMSGTIIQDFALKNNWGPRLGATYDLLGDGRTKIFGSYGRYFERVPNDLAARALSSDDTTSRADYFDAKLTQPIPNGTTAGGVTQHFLLAGVGADTIDPNAKLSYTDDWLIGIERQLWPHTSVSLRYSYRNIGRVLEDVANAPMVAYDLGVPGADNTVNYILTNPTSSTPVLANAAFLGASFDDPVHKYHAIEVTLNRRLANNWQAMASYRWSRLRGNFEGSYRDDNGQSDPGITSLYDFPTNDPSYTAIGGPQFGYRGDIRYLGDANGILPLDRPHNVKLSGSYLFPMGVGVGLNVNLSSGAPLTPLAASPNYDNGGEIPEAARGTGIQTIDGFMTRTPFQKDVDLQASYRMNLGRGRNITLLADIFNLFDSRTVLMYDQWTELHFQVPNPDFGAPVTQVLGGSPAQFQAPRYVRVGARISF